MRACRPTKPRALSDCRRKDQSCHDSVASLQKRIISGHELNFSSGHPQRGLLIFKVMHIYAPSGGAHEFITQA
jgi:hypothetical protein